jgi:hypothetical protein
LTSFSFHFAIERVNDVRAIAFDVKECSVDVVRRRLRIGR